MSLVVLVDYFLDHFNLAVWWLVMWWCLVTEEVGFHFRIG